MIKIAYLGLIGVLVACNAHGASLIAMQPKSVRQVFSVGHYSQVQCGEVCIFEVGYKEQTTVFKFDYDLLGNYVDIKTFNYFEESPGKTVSVSFEIQCKDEYLNKLPSYDENDIHCLIFFEPNYNTLLPTRIEVLGINDKEIKKEYVYFQGGGGSSDR